MNLQESLRRTDWHDIGLSRVWTSFVKCWTLKYTRTFRHSWKTQAGVLLYSYVGKIPQSHYCRMTIKDNQFHFSILVSGEMNVWVSESVRVVLSLSVCPSVRLCDCLSDCLSVCLSVCLSQHEVREWVKDAVLLSVCLCFCMSLRPLVLLLFIFYFFYFIFVNLLFYFFDNF